jgi:hypothetical protein
MVAHQHVKLSTVIDVRRPEPNGVFHAFTNAEMEFLKLLLIKLELTEVETQL